MLTIQESEIANNAVVITKRMDDEFRCTDGQIGTVRHDRFERPLNRKSASGNKTSLHDLVFYGTPTPRPTYDALRGATRNLAIKTPKLTYNGSIVHRIATGRVAP